MSAIASSKYFLQVFHHQNEWTRNSGTQSFAWLCWHTRQASHLWRKVSEPQELANLGVSTIWPVPWQEDDPTKTLWQEFLSWCEPGTLCSPQSRIWLCPEAQSLHMGLTYTLHWVYARDLDSSSCYWEWNFIMFSSCMPMIYGSRRMLGKTHAHSVHGNCSTVSMWLMLAAGFQ